MSEAGLDVTINAEGFGTAPVALLRRAVLATLVDASVTEAEVSVTLLDDAGISAMNAKWLGKDRPTDVIAFALGSGASVLGDVYVGAEQAARQAAEHGVPLDEELARLAIHGTLHVLGHDHPEGNERLDSEMFRRQEALLRAVLTSHGAG